jgi:U3 small nucleolar RNA-associated protein 4
MAVVLTPAALPVYTVVRKILNPLATSTEATFEESYQRRMAWTTGPGGVGIVKVARAARLLVAIGDSDVGVWRIRERQNGDEEVADHDDGGGWEKVLEMRLNVQTNLIAGAISTDGTWLVVSDLYEAKLFALESDVSRFTLIFSGLNGF